jgi:hypothetical protein
MKAWPEILADCGRLLSQMDDRGAAEKRTPERHVRPEAAFRINLCKSADSSTGVESIVGGIPKIVTCVVNSIAPRLSSRWLPPGPNEIPIGVVMRQKRRGDLYIFYRACDATLVLYTLPEKMQSKVILVPIEGDEAIRQATLGGDVSRIEFSTLRPGSYLVASFSMVNLDAVQRQALWLKGEGRHSEALALVEETLDLEPEDFVGWTRKGYVLRAMDRPEEAMAAVEEALKINPQCAFAWRAKGALLRDAGKHQEGLNCYLRSLDLDPTDFLCWQNKGNALQALGRDAEAQKAYAKASEVQELYPDEKH